jgi:hypothetical protein
LPDQHLYLYIYKNNIYIYSIRPCIVGVTMGARLFAARALLNAFIAGGFRLSVTLSRRELSICTSTTPCFLACISSLYVCISRLPIAPPLSISCTLLAAVGDGKGQSGGEGSSAGEAAGCARPMHATASPARAPPCSSIQSEAADVDHGADSDSVIVYAAVIDICQSELL